ncbi:MAG: hypothetical protein ABDI07_10730 [Candidatus Kryptonium sp.]
MIRKGVLKIYDGENNIIMESENLILYSGREFIMSILLNSNNSNIAQQSNSYRLGFWALGNGGLLDPFDPTTRILPSPNDLDLNNKLQGFDSNLQTVTNNRFYKRYSNTIFLTDSTNNDRYLITVVTLRLEENEFENTHINEAGLYLARSENAKDPNNDFKIFSKTTFPSVFKSAGNILNFSWHFYT